VIQMETIFKMSEALDRRIQTNSDRRAIPPDVDRRKDDKSLLVLVQLVHDEVKGLQKKVGEIRDDESLALAEAVNKLMIASFPGGDPIGHKAIHEADIQAAKDKAEFWHKMRFELSRAGLLGFLAWAGVQLWHGALAGPSK